jgi:hypothetical protein
LTALKPAVRAAADRGGNARRPAGAAIAASIQARSHSALAKMPDKSFNPFRVGAGKAGALMHGKSKHEKLPCARR